MRLTTSLLLILSLGPVACKTTVPASDSTRPEITLHYRLEGETWTDLDATRPYRPDFEGILYLWAEATDPDGLRSISIDAEGTFLCSGTTVGTVSVHESTPAEPDLEVGEETVSTRNVVASIDLSAICSVGSPSGLFTVHAYAENYGGGTAHSHYLRVRTD